MRMAMMVMPRVVRVPQVTPPKIRIPEVNVSASAADDETGGAFFSGRIA
jgi:hypothetical protein